LITPVAPDRRVSGRPTATEQSIEPPTMHNQSKETT
jgi:hypothetical protein